MLMTANMYCAVWQSQLVSCWLNQRLSNPVLLSVIRAEMRSWLQKSG